MALLHPRPDLSMPATHLASREEPLKLRDHPVSVFITSLVVHAFNVSHFQVPKVPQLHFVEQFGLLILTLFIVLVDQKNAQKCLDEQLAH